MVTQLAVNVTSPLQKSNKSLDSNKQGNELNKTSDDNPPVDQGELEDGRFEPETINNKYHLSDYLPTHQIEAYGEEKEEKENKQRLTNGSNNINKSQQDVYGSATDNTEVGTSPRNTTFNVKTPGSDKENMPIDGQNMSTQYATFTKRKATAPVPDLSDQIPLPVKLDDDEDDDVNEIPTWLRRLSIFQNHPTNNDVNSNRWKDIKQAFNKKFRKDNLVLSQPRRGSNFPESEAQARMRASNLITSILAGAPAALFTGMAFTTDEHNDRRAPLLLPLLGLEVKEISTTSGHHKKFQIDLEYGVGDNRLKWTIVKDLRALISLHSKLKVSVFQFKNIRGTKIVELPKFPKFREDLEENQGATLNDKYLSERHEPDQTTPVRDNFQTFQDDHRNHKVHIPGRNDDSHTNMENDHTDSDGSASFSNQSDVGNGGFRNRLQAIVSRASLIGSREIVDDQYLEQNEVFRRRIEHYLKQLIANFSLQPQANRLFQFFELSPIGVLLSYETGYQGKQGYLIVGTSAKSQGWRVGHLRFSDLKQMVKRHTNKWFLIRDSYVMYVSGIYSTTPLEVFLVDSSFKVTFAGKGDHKLENLDNESIYDDAISLDDRVEHSESKHKLISTHFVIKLENGERSMKLFAKSENLAKLWVQSFETLKRNTIFAQKHRFDSFAPVRKDCYAQWFVDGRDHFWAIASALELAKDVIYIHDWWLSPEVYLRRPANGNQEWRLDRVLKRKAEEGVKIFVIVYRNVGQTVVTDSLWTKHSLIDLHPNIHVLRSPTQWLQNIYFWAHHEKLCIIDHTVSFVGGIDLCYGRFDTPDHVLVDDSEHQFANEEQTGEDAIKFQNFPGKDYSNPRVKDFYELDKPYESMYDRQVTPRMPWHDVHMMTAGQPATDLSRHFVQRWNYILRQKRPSRPTPLLTPPPEWREETIKRFNLSGTCEVQMLRSSGSWSLGLKETEHSIQNAYLKLIETSEHFVYMENQFFITATTFDGVVIENRIGDALVDRIIKAHNEKKKWRAVIVIPLMPGFEAQVDEADGSAVRVIMKCQYMSISRGEASIFGKLQKMNINPYEYIQFFSLRKWGRIGPSRRIVTEQLYIHSKILIVDDRTALIGSANINERSQKGNRDSEVACVVRDTETIETTMNGVPFKAGRFAHTLRMRLLREHVGIDVDTLEIVEKRFKKIEELAAKNIDHKTHNFSKREYEIGSSKVELASRDVLNLPDGTEKWKKFNTLNQNTKDRSTEKPEAKSQESNPENEYDNRIKLGNSRLNMNSSAFPPTLMEDETTTDSKADGKSQDLPKPVFIHSFNNRAREENLGIREKKAFSGDARITQNVAHKNDVDGKGADGMGSKEYSDYKINAAKTLKRWAEESLANDKNKLFLPNVEQVLEFLDDDNVLGDNIDLSNDQELWIHERNEERWNMLKRITYLQRVAAKQQKQIDEENLKRAKTGLAKLSQKVSGDSSQDVVDAPSIGNSAIRNVISEETVEKAKEAEEPLGEVEDSSNSSGHTSPLMSKDQNSTSVATSGTTPTARDFALGGLDQVEEIHGLPGHNIPVISLDTSGIREILAKSTYNPDAANETNYIDPYCFNDPLSESFYEDLLFDIALRNTLIYREVFHCQPDDTVTTWKQYKEFTRLGTAFNLAQDQEILARERNLAESTKNQASTLSPNDNISDIGSDTRSINLEDIDAVHDGILGNAPPNSETNAGPETSSSGPGVSPSSVSENHGRRTKSSMYGMRKRLARGENERVFDIATSERLLDEVQGHLVLFPVDWLYKEIDGGNWFYNMDRVPPIEIYD